LNHGYGSREQNGNERRHVHRESPLHAFRCLFEKGEAKNDNLAHPVWLNTESHISLQVVKNYVTSV
jgi:hypothetical protein